MELNKDGMVSKTKQAVAKYIAGDIKAALRLVSDFRIGITQEEKKSLKRGYEAIVWPQNYRQLGKNPEDCVAMAKGVFEKKFLRRKA